MTHLHEANELPFCPTSLLLFHGFPLLLNCFLLDRHQCSMVARPRLDMRTKQWPEILSKYYLNLSFMGRHFSNDYRMCQN